MIRVCKGCEKRYPGCHSKCEDYFKDKDRHDRMLAKARKNRAIENDWFSSTRQAKKKKKPTYEYGKGYGDR